MSFLIDNNGGKVEVNPSLDWYRDAAKAGMSVASHVNNLFKKDVNLKLGTPFEQICASEGLTLVADNPFGLRDFTLQQILEGDAGDMLAGNTRDRSSPYGSASRTLFAAAVIEMIEDAIQPDRVTDDGIFRSMVAKTVTINSDTYEQPVISYAGAGGANAGTTGARAARVSQLSEVPTILKLTTSDRFRKIGAYGIGIEISDQAAKATTLDIFGMTVNRYIQIEKDARVYTYLSNLFAGDSDQNIGAVSAVTTASLDSGYTAGAVSHKAWLKFLARNRRKRQITHCICDLDTYLKIEARSGRPGSNNYDPTLARIDPQLQALTQQVGFGNDVKWFLVDAAADGGPVPANTVWALDAKQAIKVVRNTEADFRATQEFVLRRSTTAVWHWSEEAMRMWGDSELTPFDVLTISMS